MDPATTVAQRGSRRFDRIAALLASAMVGVAVWATAPLLGQFPGSVLPWPAHGLALAVLLLVRREDRVRSAVTVGVAAFIGGALGSGLPAQAFAASTLLVGQSVLVVLLFERFAGDRFPLDATGSYARWLGAVFAGMFPLAVVAQLAMRVAEAPIAPAFSALNWWVAGVSSSAALVPVLLGMVWRDARQSDARPLVSAEFALVAVVYLVALADAFLLMGPLGGILPPIIATLPFLAWAGLRFGIQGFSVIGAMLIVVVLASTVAEVGPFQVFDPDGIERARRAWVYLASLVGPAMIFPVALAERSLAERRMRAAHAQLTSIVESSGDLIAAVDRDLVVLAVNPAWVEEFERISAVRVSPGMRMSDAFAFLPGERPISLAHWRRALAGERFVSAREIGDPARARDEYEISYAPVRDPRGEIVGVSQVVRKISERRRREAESAEARRLESIGRLAGGIAHDFNNLMTAVMGYADLLMHSLPPADPRRDDVAEIERAALRAGELTQQLLAFARRRVIEPRLVDAGALVGVFSRLLGPLIGGRIALVVRSARGLHPIRVDPTQFEQVVMNLAVNARDAMPEGGRLLIETANDEREGRSVVRLSVRDSGSGMSAEVQARIFEPFFTTKPLGEGTGLGLPTVHGIVHQAGGEIEVESAPGLGTAFHVYFPPAGPRITPSLDGPLPPSDLLTRAPA
jgi:signal transduction histidine kinase